MSSEAAAVAAAAVAPNGGNPPMESGSVETAGWRREGGRADRVSQPG